MFDALAAQVAQLRRAVLPAEAHDDPEGWKRFVKFLSAFYTHLTEC
jgi:hypothetical protein